MKSTAFSAAALALAASVLGLPAGKPAPKTAAAAPAASPAGDAAEAAALRSPKKIAEGVWAVMTKGGANAGWFTFGDSIVAIDAGRTEADGEQLLADIAATAGRKKVSYLVLTNDFGPHAGGAVAFAKKGATLLCHESFVGGFQSAFEKAGAAAPLAGISTRLLLAAPGRHVVVRHMGPADSAGDLVVLLGEEKILFSGDLADSVLLPPLLSKTIDPEGWLAALTTLGNLNPKALVPGYGPIGPPEGIGATRDYLEHAISAAQTIVKEKIPDDYLPTRLGQPDLRIAGLLPDLENSHQANVRALVAHYRGKGSAAAPTKKP
jgi:cyclase